MAKKKRKGLVYSTDTGRMCPDCGLGIQQCDCGRKKRPVGDGVVRISRQTKGRRGGTVSMISGLPLTGNDLKKLGKQLKKKCGTGGTVKEGVIEIQGDHRKILLDTLLQMGYGAKMSGG